MGSLESLAAVGGSVCCRRAAGAVWNTLEVSPKTECTKSKAKQGARARAMLPMLLASPTDRTRDGVEGPAPGCVHLGSPAPMALPHWFQHNPSVCLNFGAFGDWTLSRFMKRCWAGAGVTLLLGNQGPE